MCIQFLAMLLMCHFFYESNLSLDQTKNRWTFEKQRMMFLLGNLDMCKWITGLFIFSILIRFKVVVNCLFFLLPVLRKYIECRVTYSYVRWSMLAYLRHFWMMNKVVCTLSIFPLFLFSLKNLSLLFEELFPVQKKEVYTIHLVSEP